MSDYIDRQAALASIKALFPDMPRMEFKGNRRRWREEYSQYLNAGEAIRQVPSADVELVRRGRWKYRKADGGCHTDCVCSECKAKFAIGWKYCPNCGSKNGR